MTARPDIGAPGGLRRIGRYTLLRELGRGGIGAVYLARKDGASEICVLKQLLVEHADNRGLERRFRREAHLTSQLDHPNIARVLDAGTEDEGFFIAFELISGQTVTAILQRLDEHDDWLTPSIALRISLEVLDGLVHAHGRTDSEGRSLGLVHRDLSPNNVMLTYDGGVKIIDFGLAAAKIDDFKTAAGQFIGTLRYMSPEQAMTKPVDPRADLYTVAVVLYEMLTRTRAVPKASVKDTLQAIIAERPPLLSSVVQGLPPALSDVLARALEKSPEARYPSAAALKDALLGVRGLRPASSAEVAQLLARWFAKEREAALRLTDEHPTTEETLLVAHTEETAFGRAASALAEPPTRLVDPEARRPRPEPPRVRVAREGPASDPAAPRAARDDASPRAGADARPSVAAWDAPSLPIRVSFETSKRNGRLVWLAALPLFGVGLLAGVWLVREGRPPSAPAEVAVEEPAVAPTIVPRPAARSVDPGTRDAAASPPGPEAVPERDDGAGTPSRGSDVSAGAREGARRPEEAPVDRGRARTTEAGAARAVRPSAGSADPEVRRTADPRRDRRSDPSTGGVDAGPASDRHTALVTKLERLRASPAQGALLVELHREIKAAAASLPEDTRRLVEADLDAGLRGGDVEALARALARLRAAG